MALNIKDAETDRLARELAQITGESITEATRGALRERLKRERARADLAAGAPALRDIIQRGRSRPVLDDRPADEILGYDSRGLPT